MTRPRRAAVPTPLEYAEHKAFAQYLAIVEAANPGLCFTCIDHGVRLSVGLRAKLKHKGVKPGVADFWIGYRGKSFFVELKRVKDGTQSEDQKTWQRRVTLAGHAYFLAKGADAAIEFVDQCVLADRNNLGHGL